MQASYLTVVATRMDSSRVPDHLNSLFPRSIMTPKYVGTARLAPKVDACLEPWTVLGHLAARNRLSRLMSCLIAAVNRGDRAAATSLARQVPAVDRDNADAEDLLPLLVIPVRCAG